MRSYNKQKIDIIPPDWSIKRIGDFVTKFVGGAPLTPNDFTDSGIKVLPKKGIQKGGKLIISDTKQCYTSFQFAEKNESSIVTQEYLITVLRDLVPTAPSIGLIVQIPSDERYLLAQGVYGMIVSSNIDSNFLIHYSNSVGFRFIMKTIKVGSTQVHIRNEDFLNVPVPYPPIQEQRKIAEILSTVDEQIELTDQLIEKTTLLKKGIKKSLLTSGIGHTDYKMTEIGEIPSTWKVKSLCEAAQIIMGQSPSSTTYNENGMGLPLFQGKTEFGETFPVVKKWCTEPTKISQPNDVLISVRAPVGAVNINNVTSCIGRGLAAIRPKTGVNYQFIFYLLASMEDRFSKFSQGSTFTAINSSDLKSLRVQIPPYKEQCKIVEILWEIDKNIDNYKSKLKQLKTLKEGLMQKLLTGKIRVKV